MQVKVRYLDNLRLEASFDDFTVITDQPVRYKGDGTAPGPFDYFLASSALCAAYFVKVYCNARDISTDDIRITQDNIVDPENRYQQTFTITAEIPDEISEKDKQGIINSMDRCTVKRVVQNAPEFKINTISSSVKSDKSQYKLDYEINENTQTMIKGKDFSLEETIKNMTSLLSDLGIKIEIASWRNNVPHVWSVHIRDADSPMCFTNGKGATKDSALCSALGEYLERISNNYFYNDYFLGQEIAESSFVHYPNEKWFLPNEDDSLPTGLMDDVFLKTYNIEDELKASHLIDMNSGAVERGICALPFERYSDKETVYIPVNLIGNLFVSNGMSAGNTIFEARVQCLSEIFERAVKNQIIRDEISLPDVPKEIISQYPTIKEGIQKLEEKGFPILIKDASLGGKFPVICVTLMNPKTGGVFASFGAHPNFEVALERTLTELLQGRSFEGLNEMPAPTFGQHAVTEHNNIVDHFIDSTGIISWKFFSSAADYKFKHWDFTGSTEEEFNFLMDILADLKKEVYIADYTELGAKACRILVPDYSEIYEVDDLIWDNHNKALLYREDILKLNDLTNQELSDLLERLEESELDDYHPISELIGVAFDENSIWGQCTVSELKGLIHLALKNYDEAKSYVEMFNAFNDSIPTRKRFYQILNIILDIKLDPELHISDYITNLSRMYGKASIETAIDCVEGKIKFHGLTPTDMNLTGIDKHERLIESYKKIQRVRRKFFT